MSKTQQAKTAQGYIEKPVHPMCSNCSSIKNTVHGVEGLSVKKISICTLGNFATKKQATCLKHEFKTI